MPVTFNIALAKRSIPEYAINNAVVMETSESNTRWSNKTQRIPRKAPKGYVKKPIFRTICVCVASENVCDKDKTWDERQKYQTWYKNHDHWKDSDQTDPSAHFKIVSEFEIREEEVKDENEDENEQDDNEEKEVVKEWKVFREVRFVNTEHWSG